MNIFALHENPYTAVQEMCDVHIVKMIVESCQLLSTHDRLTKNLPEDDTRYKVTHQNHPCRVCLSYLPNYVWLVKHLHALLLEYTYRYGKTHKSAELFHKHWEPYLNMYHGSFAVKFPKCMPDEYKVGDESIESVVASYRNYYKFKKISMYKFRYTGRTEPMWLQEN